jgi:hypothetical protein
MSEITLFLICFVILAIAIFGYVILDDFQSNIKNNFAKMYPDKFYTESIFYYIVENNGIILVPKLSLKNKDKSQHIRLSGINDIKFFQDGKEKSNTGKTIAGAITFGLPGAIVGSTMKGKKIIKDMGIKIYTDKEVYSLDFVGNGCEEGSQKFRNAMLKIDATYNILLKYIKGDALETSISNKSNMDIADQIEKLANLKEKGILTEEEFRNKKTELLERI